MLDAGALGHAYYAWDNTVDIFAYWGPMYWGFKVKAFTVYPKPWRSNALGLHVGSYTIVLVFICAYYAPMQCAHDRAC